MQFQTARDFARARPKLPTGVAGVVLADTQRHAQASVSHLVERGAGAIVVIGDAGPLETDGCPLIRIAEKPGAQAQRLLSEVLDALAGRWVAWLWAGEFLFYPFAETRSLPELAAFLADERRKVLFCYALDLYAPDMPGAGEAPWDRQLHFDRIGYQPFPQPDRRLNLHGGLGWRFEEMSPVDQHQIGRSSLVRAEAGMALDRAWRFGDEDRDSVSCPWHNSPTGAVMSLRRAYRVLAHPGFPDVADDLIWQGSTPFDWTSRQLLELGMIEPGQWF